MVIGYSIRLADDLWRPHAYGRGMQLGLKEDSRESDWIPSLVEVLQAQVEFADCMQSDSGGLLNSRGPHLHAASGDFLKVAVQICTSPAMCSHR